MIIGSDWDARPDGGDDDDTPPDHAIEDFGSDYGEDSEQENDEEDLAIPEQPGDSNPFVRPTAPWLRPTRPRSSE